MKSIKQDIKPWSGFLFFFNLLAYSGVLIIINQSFEWSATGLPNDGTLQAEFGTNAIIIGIGTILVAFVMLYQYIKVGKSEIVQLIYSKDKLNSIYLIWTIFIMSPIFMNNYNKIESIVVFSFLAIINVIYSRLYHRRICKHN